MIGSVMMYGAGTGLPLGVGMEGAWIGFHNVDHGKGDGGVNESGVWLGFYALALTDGPHVAPLVGGLRRRGWGGGDVFGFRDLCI